MNLFYDWMMEWIRRHRFAGKKNETDGAPFHISDLRYDKSCTDRSGT